MEYRRRSTRTRRNEKSGSGGKLLIVLILTGAAVYLLSASAAGTWIAQHVFAPVFEAFSGDENDTPVSTDTPVISTGTDASQGEASEVMLPGIEVYILQMGVFESDDNADEAAKNIKKRGAGGYIMEDDGKYRVFAAAYSGETEAKSVKDRLSGEEIDSTVHAIAMNDISFNVTASETIAEEVAQAFTSLSKAQGDMLELALKFDEDELEVNEGVKELSPVLSELNQNRERLLRLNTDNNVFRAVLECFDSYIQSLETLSAYDGKNIVEFSSEMKYTQLQMIDRYVELLEALSA